ncbi:SgcJ/EcaC family oxidoreductase [Arthrobacter gyeryongensis]|uniref:SgcJ/EcaC family oxidoreductase n=1 Tax=Arthrobacter gyeryongensis TaxID=1650592 RepID=A0ABP9SUN2_9MICC
MPPTRVLAETLTAWKLAFNSHRPEDMVELFSLDALFQGLTPALLTGREDIFGYYDALSPGITTSFHIIQTRQLTQNVVCGFATVSFTYPDRHKVPVQLSLVLRRAENRWLIAQYHVSSISRGKPSGEATMSAVMNPFGADDD